MITREKFFRRFEPGKVDSVKKHFEQLRLAEDRKIRNEIMADQNSTHFVNLCVYPFIAGGKLAETGYEIYSLDPYYYTGLKNFDVLLYNKDEGSSIFVECRSGTTFSNTLGDELKDKIERTQGLLLKQNIYGIQTDKLEFVLMINAVFDDQVTKILNGTAVQEKIKVWKADLHGGIIILHSGQHTNEKLTKSLTYPGVKCKDYNDVFNIMPSTHIARKLEFVSSRMEIMLRNEGHEKFRLSDVVALLKEVFLNYPIEETEKISKTILSEGEDIGIFSALDEEFYILNVGRKMGAAGDEAKEKYIKYKSEKDAEGLLFKEYPTVIEEMEKEEQRKEPSEPTTGQQKML
ncbi:MAG: hypothetical protein QXH07_03010 [Thermoplasmata archaeon]